MAGRPLDVLPTQYIYINVELGAPALFYLVFIADPDTVDCKHFSFLAMKTYYVK
jgi:hypothetical protein